MTRQITAVHPLLRRQPDTDSEHNRLMHYLLEQMDDVAESDYFETPQKYGAVADGVTDDTAAIQAAIDAAQDNSTYLYLPSGTYRYTTSLYNVGGLLIKGSGHENGQTLLYPDGCHGFHVSGVASAIAARVQFRDFQIDAQGSAQATVSAVADNGGLLQCTATAHGYSTGDSVHLDGFSTAAYNDTVDTITVNDADTFTFDTISYVGADSGTAYGYYHGFWYDDTNTFPMARAHFENLTIKNMSGKGFYSQDDFSFQMNNIHVSGCGHNAIDFEGATAITLISCYVHLMGTSGKVAYRIQKAATLIACNGIDSPDKESIWGHFGNTSPIAGAQVVLIGCNIEDVDDIGIFHEFSGTVSFYNNKFIAPASGNFTYHIKSDVNPGTDVTSIYIGPGNSFASKGATADGGPAGVDIYAHNPMFHGASERDFTADGTNTWSAPQIQTRKSAALYENAIAVNRLLVEEFLRPSGTQWKQRFITSTDSPYTILDDDAILRVQTTTAAITLTLPDSDSSQIGRSIVVLDNDGNAATNNITINTNGSDTLLGAFSKVLDQDWHGIHLVSNSSLRWLVAGEFTDSSTTEINDLSAAVTWANVPDANITASSVEQHIGSTQEASTASYTCTGLQHGTNLVRATGSAASITIPETGDPDIRVLVNDERTSGSDLTIVEGFSPTPYLGTAIIDDDGLNTSGIASLSMVNDANLTYFDSNGVLQTATANTAVLDHEYNGSAWVVRGVPYFESRTQKVQYPEEIDNAWWNVRGTASVTANDTTAPDGTTTADKITGIGTGANDIYKQIFSWAGSGGAVGASFFIKRISTTGVLNFDNAQGTASGLFEIDLSAIGSDWVRIEPGATGVTVVNAFVGDGGGSCGPRFDAKSGGPLSFYLWGVQMESGGVSPYISASGSDVTRTACYAKVTTLSDISYDTTEGTLLTTFVPSQAEGETFVAAFSDGTATNEIEQYVDSSDDLRFAVEDSGTQASLNHGAVTAEATTYIASSWDANDFASSEGGATALTDTSGTVDAGISQLNIGSDYNNANQLNGHISHMRYIETAQSDATLEAYSTDGTQPTGLNTFTLSQGKAALFYRDSSDDMYKVSYE